jgi:hypothetical protein
MDTDWGRFSSNYRIYIVQILPTANSALTFAVLFSKGKHIFTMRIENQFHVLPLLVDISGKIYFSI